MCEWGDEELRLVKKRMGYAEEIGEKEGMTV